MQNTNNITRTFFILSALFITSLVVANTIATKIIDVFGLSVAAGIICFPLSYILSDVITEVYGFKRARFVIWVGFGCLAIAVLMYAIASALPPAAFYANEEAFDLIFSQVPRIALGSLFGYLVGSLSNAIVLSKMKVWLGGKHLWARTIGSTVVGEAADSIVFALIAFSGVLGTTELIIVATSGFILKTAYEVLATPVTYAIVNKVKKVDGIDTYDADETYKLI